MKIFLKSAVLLVLFGPIACGGNSKDTLGPGDSDEITADTRGICNRTSQVRNAILAMLSDINNCALVTEAHLSSITYLNLGFRRITALQRSDFYGLDNLSWLDLSLNFLSTPKDSVFSGLKSLESLDLSYNSLQTLPASVFSGLDSLRVLNLKNNDLNTLPEGIFTHLDNLQSLGLSFKDLHTLPENMFSDLPNLQKLRLHTIGLRTLPEGVFSGLDNLQDLSLYNNNLSRLPEGIFSGLSKLKLLWLQGNPGTPFTLTIELERTDNMDNNAPGPATILVKVAEGAPFDMTVSLSAQGGTLSANTATIVAGEIKSETVVVSPGEDNSVTVSLGSAPELPQFLNHAGFQTAVGDSLVLFGQASNRQGN